MPVPVVYRKSGEGAIASYNFYDIGAGIGYKTFYGMDLVEVSTDKYALSPEVLSPLVGYTYSGQGGTLDLDFDLSIQIPLILKGNCLINVPIGCEVPSLQDLTIPVTIKLYKVSGGVETQLGGTVTKSIILLAVNTGANKHKILAGRIIVPTTLFKSGDTIRISVATAACGANNRSVIYHDPTNSTANLYPGDGSTSSISLLVDLPFRIDL